MDIRRVDEIDACLQRAPWPVGSSCCSWPICPTARPGRRRSWRPRHSSETNSPVLPNFLYRMRVLRMGYGARRRAGVACRQPVCGDSLARARCRILPFLPDPASSRRLVRLAPIPPRLLPISPDSISQESRPPARNTLTAPDPAASVPVAGRAPDPPFPADMIPASTLATASARAEVLRLLDRMTGTLEGSIKHRRPAPVPSRSAPSPLSRPPRCRSSPRAPSCCWSATKPEVRPLPLPDLVGGPAGGRQGVGGQPEPALGLRLDLHPEAITALISDENLPPAPPSDTSRALSVNPLDDTLLDALLRLLRLLDTRATFPSWRR